MISLFNLGMNYVFYCPIDFMIARICASDGFLPICAYIERIIFSVIGGFSLICFSNCLLVTKKEIAAPTTPPKTKYKMENQKLFITIPSFS